MSLNLAELGAPRWTGDDPLARLREAIDELDAELLERFVARLELARQIGAHKRECGLAVGDRRREQQVRATALARTRGRCPPALVEALVAELFRSARRVQERPRVAYLGPATTHSHHAVSHWFEDAQLHPCASLRAAIEAVSSDAADYAVVPWANRHAGPIVEVQAAVTEAGARLREVDRAALEVSHVLAAPPSHSPGVTIERLFCRPEPYAGARSRLPIELVAAAVESVTSNDEAARRAAACPRSAAITTIAAAEAWGLAILAEAIDGTGNQTTFVVLTVGDEPA